MRKVTRKILFLAVCYVVFLSGCMKSNIVKPKEYMEPDFNLYNNIVLDMKQFHTEIDDIYLDEEEYPMASAVDITVVVKDDTSAKDTAEYVDAVIKGINDEAATQDYNYGESGENTFGGLFQNNEIRLKIYKETEYKGGKEPMYETTVPKDTYMKFEIKS